MEQRKRGRPRKGKERPKSRPFDPKEPHGECSPPNKFLSQGGAYYTYAEAKGPYDEKVGKRLLLPKPKFIAWIDDFHRQEKLEAYHKLKVQTATFQAELGNLESQLKREGVLEDAST
jgi:hypothetical protein